MNLVRNAAQAAPPTGGTLQIVVRDEEEEVVLRFEDDGPGVPAEHAPSLFRRGFSLRGGSGLGLSLVREVIEDEMRVRARHHPHPVGGAVFELRLPRRGGVER